MIWVENLTVHAGSFSLTKVGMEVPAGEHAILMGKTGSGKTTLLESICGLRQVSAGRIVLDGIDVTHRKPADRGVGYVPQDAALFSTMTVRDHLAFSLVVRRWRRRAIDERVEELADLLGLESLLHRYPQGLSGGEAQRVALGRALASRPSILCLDEPISALDDETREEICGLLASVQKRTGVTALHITHRLGEVQVLADRVLSIREGQIQLLQEGKINGAAAADRRVHDLIAVPGEPHE